MGQRSHQLQGLLLCLLLLTSAAAEATQQENTHYFNAEVTR
jgi:hypothetical protein